MGNGANLWIYWLSEFLGAAVAAVLFLVVNQEQPSIASRDRAQEQTNYSRRAVEHCLAARHVWLPAYY